MEVSYSQPAVVTISTSSPATPVAGTLWWDSTYGSLKVYYNDGNTSQWVDASLASAYSGNIVTVSDVAPTSNQSGDLWWDSSYGTLKIYYNDGTSSQWVDTYSNSSNGINSSVITQVELDFGSTPTRSKKFTITNANVTASSQLQMWQSADAPTGRSNDENEMDAFVCRVYASTGTIIAYIDSLLGPVAGKYKFNYANYI